MIDNEVSRTFDRRSALFLTGGAVLTSILVLRMLQMQLFSYQDYKKKSESNSFRIQVNIPERGQILSKNNTPISRDIPTYRIYIIPEESDDIETLVKTVATDLGLREKSVKNIHKKIQMQFQRQRIPNQKLHKMYHLQQL